MQPQDAISPIAGQIGQQLRAAREARGLSLHDVADRLKLSLRQLEAIEAGDFARLPGATFVRGFVRNYARFLELDSEALLHALDNDFPPVKVESAIVAKAEAPAAAAPGPLRQLWWLLPLLAVGGLVWWLQGQNGSASAPAVQASAEVVEPVASEVLGGEVQPTPASAALVLAPASAPAVASIPAVVLPQPASAAAAAVASKRLVLRARDEAWVSVTDAKGSRLLHRLLASGTAQEVSGTPPFKVVLGNAGKVELDYDGAAVDFKNKIRGATAKLELN